MIFWLLFTCTVGVLFYLHHAKIRRYPPGPLSLPIVGTVDTLINGGKAGILAEQKYYKYGPMMSFFVGSSTVFVIINDFQLAKDLFLRDEFSGRLKTWWHQNVRGNQGRNLGIINTDGTVWTEQRRFALKQLRDLGFGRKSLDSIMIEEVDVLIDQLDGLTSMDSTFNTPIINVLWQIVASKRFDPQEPRTKKLMGLLNMQFKHGLNRLAFFPLLGKILPYNAIDKSLFELKQMMRQLIHEHMHSIDLDNPRDFIDVYLKEIQSNPKPSHNFDIEQLIVICLDFFQAGAETTSTTLLWAVMLMALYPKVQQKCQKEIDEILGGSRLPTIDDMPKLVYVMATLMEIQRFSKVAPGSLPHMLIQDVQVMQYKFKKGTIFISNLTKFLNDPIIFPNPEEFIVERFLEDGKLKKYEEFVPFGIGKRICMGESLAKNELFIFFVRTLQRLNFKVAEGLKPNPQKYTAGITRIPDPYYVHISKRSEI
uniref:Cytochrome P450 3041B1 n=1 Tax=Paracyclopina nana TaxID=565004 RepID=A0A0F7IZY2_PARNA|nr:cytochrome P450 3041B1 [Paracyclopina nana]